MRPEPNIRVEPFRATHPQLGRSPNGTNWLESHLKAYREKFPRCQGRNCHATGKDIHEIAGGPVRMKAREKRSCILHLCRRCHRLMQHWDKDEQLAVKLLADPAGYDLDEYNEVVKGHLMPVSQAKVDVAIERITSH